MRRIGPYEVVDNLARGGAGVVFEVRDSRQGPGGPHYALKLLSGRHDERARKRFQREAEALAALRHPGVVQVHTAGTGPEGPYLVLELVRGRSLQHRLDHEGPLLPREAASLVAELAVAVDHVHARNLLHRDLKPANVLLDQSGAPKLTDFGLTRQALPSASQTKLSQQGAVMGTPGFWAPEQARGAVADCGAHTDVYGLGATLFAALTGRAPHDPDGVRSMFEQIAAAQRLPPPPSSLQPEVDAGLDAVCARALQPDPAARYPSAAHLERDLRRYLAGEALSVSPPRRLRGGLLLALGLLGVAGGAAWLVSTPAEGRPSPAPVPSTSLAASPPPQPQLTRLAWLDGAALLDPAQLPQLEVHEPWGLQLVEESILIRAHGRARTELRLPLELRSGGTFEIRARLRLPTLETTQRIMLLLQRSAHPGKLDGIGIMLDSTHEALTQPSALSAALLGTGHSLGVVEWEPQTPHEHVQPSGELQLALSSRSGRLQASLECRGQTLLERELGSSEDLPSDIYWLRLGANLRSGVEVQLQEVGAGDRDQPAFLAAWVDELEVLTGARGLSVPSRLDPRPLGRVGRLGRAYLSGRELERVTSDLLEMLARVDDAGIEHSVGHVMLLLPLAHTKAGRPEQARQALRSVEALTSMGDREEWWESAWTSALHVMPPEHRALLAESEIPTYGIPTPEAALQDALRLSPQLARADSIRSAAFVALLFERAGPLAHPYPFERARAWLYAGDLPLARELFAEAAASGHTSALAWEGMTAYRMGDYGGAVSAWERLGQRRATLRGREGEMADYVLGSPLASARAALR